MSKEFSNVKETCQTFMAYDVLHYKNNREILFASTFQNIFLFEITEMEGAELESHIKSEIKEIQNQITNFQTHELDQNINKKIYLEQLDKFLQNKKQELEKGFQKTQILKYLSMNPISRITEITVIELNNHDVQKVFIKGNGGLIMIGELQQDPDKNNILQLTFNEGIEGQQTIERVNTLCPHVSNDTLFCFLIQDYRDTEHKKRFFEEFIKVQEINQKSTGIYTNKIYKNFKLRGLITQMVSFPQNNYILIGTSRGELIIVKVIIDESNNLNLEIEREFDFYQYKVNTIMPSQNKNFAYVGICRYPPEKKLINQNAFETDKYFNEVKQYQECLGEVCVINLETEQILKRFKLSQGNQPDWIAEFNYNNRVCLAVVPKDVEERHMFELDSLISEYIQEGKEIEIEWDAGVDYLMDDTPEIK